MDSDGQYYIKVKRFLKDDHLGNVKRSAGQQKKTWEVIHDHSCDSYDIEKIPSYSIVMKALHEGANNLIKEKILVSHKNSDSMVVDQICERASISFQNRTALLSRMSEKGYTIPDMTMYRRKLSGAANTVLALRRMSRLADIALSRKSNAQEVAGTAAVLQWARDTATNGGNVEP